MKQTSAEMEIFCKNQDSKHLGAKWSRNTQIWDKNDLQSPHFRCSYKEAQNYQRKMQNNHNKTQNNCKEMQNISKKH